MPNTLYLVTASIEPYSDDDDGDAQTFPDFDSAKRAVIATMLHHADHVSESLAEDLTHLAEDLNLEQGPFVAYIRSLYFSVEPIERTDPPRSTLDPYL